MKKKVIGAILVVLLFAGGATAGASFDLFKEEINNKLQEHKDQLEMRIGQSESNSIAVYIADITEYKDQELERAKGQMDAVANKEMDQIGEQYKQKLENDKKEITNYIDEKTAVLIKELENMQ